MNRDRQAVTLLDMICGIHYNVSMEPNPKIIDILTRSSEAQIRSSGARISAAVVHRERIISFGFNQMKTHPFQAKYAKNSEAIYLHAEIDAIKNALRSTEVDDLHRCELYIVRSKQQQDHRFVHGLAAPCVGCRRAIATFRLRCVHYSTDHGEMETI